MAKIRSPVTILVFVLTLCCLNTAQGQDHYKIVRYTDAEGLPQNTIKSIFKDKYGFIWFSTENGLARFDGRGFKIFNDKNIDDISSNRMSYFSGNAERDSIYTRNNSNELLLFHQREVERIQDSTVNLLPDIKPIKSVSKLVRYQSMLMGRPYFDVGADLDINRYFTSSDRRFVMKEDSISEIYKTSDSLKRYSYNYKRGGFSFIKNNAFYNLHPNGHLYRFEEGKRTKISVGSALLKDASIYTNAVANQIFLLNHNTVYLIDSIHNNEIFKKKVAENFQNDPTSISAMYYDKSTDNLYFGTFNKGFSIVKYLPFESIKDTTHQADNIIYGMTKLNDSTLLTGTGTVVQDNNIIVRNNFNLASDKFYLAYLKKHKILWTFNTRILYQFKEQDNYRFKESARYNISDDEEFSLLQKKNEDSIWLGVWNRKQNTTSLSIQSGKESFPNQENIIKADFWITSLIEVGKDSLYLGSENGGLHLLKNYKGNLELEKLDSGIKVRSFYKDGAHLWLTSYNQGIFLIHKGELISLPPDKNNYINTAHAILGDDNGYFWITTNNGLLRASKENLYAYAQDKVDEVFYQYYDQSYGFSTNEFNGGGYPYALRLKNNNFYFPSLDGIVHFSPHELNKDLKEWDFYIDEINVDDKELPHKDSLQIKQPFDRLTVKMTYPHFESSVNLQTEAKLNGEKYSQDWTSIGADQKIGYTNLPPGDYTLKLRKRSGINPDYKYNEYYFSIAPKFWQTIWFRVSLIILGVLLVLLFVHLRLRYLEKKRVFLEQQVKIRTRDLRNTVKQLTRTENDLKKQLSFQKGMISSISHDLRTPTKYLTIISKEIYNNLKNQKSRNRNNANLIYETSKQINWFIGNLLIYAKANIKEIDDIPREVMLNKLINDCISLFDIASAKQKVTITKKIDPDISLYTNEQVLKVILQNILDNAIKNTKNGKIQIECVVENDLISLRIEDTGTGIGPQTLQDIQAFFKHEDSNKKITKPIGLGLKIIKQLLPYIKAKVEISSQSAVGTIFYLYINTGDVPSE